MRVLFTCTGGAGHLYPLMPIARAVRAAGDEVLFGVPATIVGEVERLGFRAVPTSSGRPTEESLAVFRQVWSHPEPNTLVVADQYAHALVNASLGATVDLLDQSRPDVVVSEAGEFSGQLAAARAGIPYVHVGITSQEMRGLRWEPVVERLDAHRVALGMDAAGDRSWLFRWMFATAFPDVLQSPGTVLPDTTVRYRYEDPEGAHPDAARWGGTRPSVYATLGTAAAGQVGLDETYRRVLSGLGRCDADVLFTIGSLDRALLGDVPANVRVESYVPQREAMACDVVVSHAGSGTTLAALSRGLPMVAVPLFADQADNAERITELGAGLTVAAGDADRGLATAIDRCLQDPAFRVAARSLRDQMSAHPEVGSLVPRLRALAGATLPVG